MQSHYPPPSNTAVSTIEDEPSKPPPTVRGIGHQQLIEYYQGILENQSIYYPVAYRFHRRIGKGRQGVVFLAERHGSRGCITRHAIKVFDPSIYSSVKKYWTDMGRIAAQVSRLQATRSPHLVDCDIYEESNGIGYIQMELIDGIDLRRILEGQHLELVKQRCTADEWRRYRSIIFNFSNDNICIQPGVAIYIMRQMLAGLENLHSAKYLHCDIKPGNTMIDPLGYVKIIDFGRANFINEKTSILLGSPMYMAPEIHRREPASIQTDLYSVGLVGLELIRGHVLGDAANAKETDLLDFKMRLPENLPNLLPPYVLRNDRLVEIFRRLLDPDPARRYASAQAAESISEGLALVHRQLTQLDIDSDYRRDLAGYLRLLGLG